MSLVQLRVAAIKHSYSRFDSLVFLSSLSYSFTEATVKGKKKTPKKTIICDIFRLIFTNNTTPVSMVSKLIKSQFKY